MFKMVYSEWLGVFGWGIFFIGLVTAIVLFAVKRKFYPVMYLVSIATYVFTIGFVIDAFDLSRDITLILLAFSTIIFIVLGIYFAKKFEARKSEFMELVPSKRR